MENKARHPIAYMLAPSNEPYATVAQQYELVGFTVYVFNQLAPLLETWTARPTQQSNVLIAHVNDGGLMLAHLVQDTRDFSQDYIVLLDNNRNVQAAMQALRYGVTDYLLLDEPTAALSARAQYLWQRILETDSYDFIDYDEPEPLFEEFAGDDLPKISWDESLNAVRRGDTWISLSPIEWRLFHTLIKQRGSVVSLNDLVTNGLQRSNSSDQDVPLLRLHISRLRSKLSENFGHELNVVTLRGRGYMLV
jgi:DNA-binding response OmpR family regulator